MLRRVEKIKNILKGSTVVYKGGQGRLIRHEDEYMMISAIAGVEYVRPSEYLYTLIETRDVVDKKERLTRLIQKLAPYLHEVANTLALEVWEACKEHYNIKLKSKDPRIEIALLILKGDLQALDIATDILGG